MTSTVHCAANRGRKEERKTEGKAEGERREDTKTGRQEGRRSDYQTLFYFVRKICF